MTCLEVYKYDTLYGKDIKGKIKTWQIKVERYEKYSVIVTHYGYTRLIETRRQVNSGKNLNSSNMTSAYEQALSEAKSKWTKKKDIEQFSSTIVSNIDSNMESNMESNIDSNMESTKESTIILPMLAHDYKKQKKKVIFPCFIQPKLDGFRCIYNTTTGQITTRQGKEYNIVKESGKLYKELQKLPKGLILDGELYSDKLKFEVLGVLRKTKKLSEEEVVNLEKIDYHIYDIINNQDTFEERNKQIQELNLLSLGYEKLRYVPTYEVKNEEEIKKYHTIFLEENYEGTMVRNKKSLYKPKQRSSDLLKYKDFEDAEFEIVDYTIEKDTSGADSNLVVWVVGVPSKNELVKCKVRPKGTKEERKELYKKCVENFDQFKGRYLWTKFFEYTNDGSLRFPTTLRDTYTEYIRDNII
jgi:ATP-dependent DNA ligase